MPLRFICDTFILYIPKAESPLQRACRKGFSDIVSVLLKFKSVTKLDSMEKALDIAVLEGYE